MDIIHKNGSWFYIYIYIYIYERFLMFISFLLLNKINLTIIKKKTLNFAAWQSLVYKMCSSTWSFKMCSWEGKERKKEDKSLVNAIDLVVDGLFKGFINYGYLKPAIQK